MRKSKYPTDISTLGKKIRKRRMDFEFTLLDVSSYVGISESYMSRIEADKQKPSLEVIKNIIEYLNINPYEILYYLVPETLLEILRMYDKRSLKWY